MNEPLGSARRGGLLRAAAVSLAVGAAAIVLAATVLSAPLSAQTTNSVSRVATGVQPSTALATPARDAPTIASDARLSGDEKRTRMVIDLDRAVEFQAFTLSNPNRVVLDLSEVQFSVPDEGLERARGLVSNFRYGTFGPGKARMVLDVVGPVAVDKAFVLDAVDGQPARLVIDLVKTDAASFARSVVAPADVPLPTPAPAAPPAAADDGRPVIVLDPGHGGIDSGTSGASAFNEKTIVLETALALRDKLEKGGSYRVVMTRSTDVFIPLGERVRIARRSSAALFISIHADALAANDGHARGASVYTLSETASDAEAAHLADKENKADLIAGVDLTDESDDVAGILVDLVQRETRTFSHTFARNLVASMKSTGRLHRTPLKSAGFKVLKAHDVPSVLVELGYMSSSEDLRLMTSEAWRDKVTDAMMAAIGDFFRARQKGMGLPAAAAAASAADKPGARLRN